MAKMRNGPSKVRLKHFLSALKKLKWIDTKKKCSKNVRWSDFKLFNYIWATPSEFGTYRLCEQRWFRRACASAQSRQNLHCSLIQAVSQEEPSDRKPDPWSLWMAGHPQLKFVMTECSKTQIRLTRHIWKFTCILFLHIPRHPSDLVLVGKWIDEHLVLTQLWCTVNHFMFFFKQS